MRHSGDSSAFLHDRPFQRIYHYHIRKTGGTSLNYAFFRLSGEDPVNLYARINERWRVDSGGIRYVGWQRPLIARGDWDYGFAHAAAHNLQLPPETFTFTVLRDPAARVLSHYKMLLWMRDHEPQHVGYQKEAHWIEAGFDGFLQRVSRQELQRQLFMFSPGFNVDEALAALHTVNRVLLLDDRFGDDLNALQQDIGIDLPYVHERASKVDFTPTDAQRARLRELLEPEYRLIDEMTRTLRPGPASSPQPHESVTMNDTPHRSATPADPVETAYRKLWKKKLNDEEWLRNDGEGRVQYAADLLRPALRPEHKVLDIGCGRGTLGLRLNRKQGIFGVDLAPEAIEQAKQVYEDARVVNIDAEPLPWPDNTFEYVVYLDVIEHVFDPRVGLREIQRVLKHGGKLILSTPNILAHIDDFRKTRRFPKTSGDPEPYDGGHLHFFTYLDIHDLLELTGFAHSESASRYGQGGEHEFRDKMVWVVGTKGVQPEPANTERPASPEVKKRVNVQPSRSDRFTVPTAVVTYNRPWHTEQVLNALKGKVETLYLFSDGPRSAADEPKVEQVRKLLRSVDWADVQLIERESNFGLAKSVTGAASQVFADHDRILVLEDDVVPFPGLFPFVQQALDKYEHEVKVTGISGYSIRQPEAVRRRYPYDAYFFPRISSQGWATWKNRWDRFDPALTRLVQRAAESDLDITIGGTDLVRNLQHALDGRDVWTMNWVLTAMLDQGVTLYPTESQVRNVGMDGSGMNSGTTSRFDVDDPTRVPERLPDEIFIDPDLAGTFHSYYDLKGTRRDPNVTRLGPHPVKRLLAEGYSHVASGPAAPAPAGDDPNALIETAVQELEGGKPADALAKLDRVLASEGAAPHLNLVRAICLQRLNRLDDALSATNAELAAHPSNQDARAFQTQLLSQLRSSGGNGAPTPANGTSNGNGHSTEASVPSGQTVTVKEPEQVVFISDEPRSREAKLARGLTRAGKKLVLLHKNPPSFDASRFFSEAHAYSTPEQAVELAKRYRPLAYHVFSNWNFETARTVIAARPGPVLFDDYDVMTGMLREDVIAWKHPEKPSQERYCLEKADGLVTRHLELRYLRRELGFALPPLTLAVDGCWGDQLRTGSEKLSAGDGVVRVVTVGNYNPDDPAVEGDVVYVYETARVLHEAGMQYHIYPSSDILGEKTRAGLAAQGLGHTLGHSVHVHSPLAPDELIPTIARYDYGLHILSRKVDGVRHRYELRKYEHATANKIFDFIDAGLPILVHGGRFQRFLSTRYGHGRHLRLLDELSSLTIPPPSPGVPESLLVDRIATRLLGFYRTVAAKTTAPVLEAAR